jgi:hypothetical protein
MMTVNDIWQLSTTNSNTNYQSFYFPSSIDFNNSNQYHHTTDNNHFDYQPSSTYLIDPNSHMFTNNYSMDPYPVQPVYNSTPIEPSTYITSTDSYPNLHPICNDSNVTVDYQPTSSEWDSGTTKMPSDDGMYNKLTVFYIQKWMPICLFFFSLTNTKQKSESQCPLFSHINIKLKQTTMFRMS